MNRYDGHLGSLKDKSRRPHHHAKQHTEAELKQIRNMRRRNPNAGIVVLWVKLRQKGYSRSISGLLKVLKASGRSCLVGAAATEAAETGGFFQYTFIDEYSRFRYLEAFKEHNTYSSSEFIKHCIKRFPYAIECVQTDNGFEFTNRLNSQCSDKETLFERTLRELGIRHKLIKPYTPRHNGKVERSHRKDNEYFYAVHKFFSFEDFQKQLAAWNRKYNDFPMRPLNWLSPKETLFSFLNCKA